MDQTQPKTLQELEAAADEGDAQAQTALALLYELGLEGGQVDLKKAREYWGMAASSGTPWAQLEYATMLEKGVGGNQDTQQAKSWMRRAEEAGFQSAETAIERCASQQNADQGSVRWAGNHVLLVEDSKTTRSTLAKTLNALGLNVLEAEDGLQGLEVLSKSPDLDLIIADIYMPNCNGLEFAAKVRSLSKYKKIPIVILTSENRNTMIVQGKNIGITGWLLKPTNEETIRRALTKVLR